MFYDIQFFLLFQNMSYIFFCANILLTRASYCTLSPVAFTAFVISAFKSASILLYCACTFQFLQKALWLNIIISESLCGFNWILHELLQYCLYLLSFGVKQNPHSWLHITFLLLLFSILWIVSLQIWKIRASKKEREGTSATLSFLIGYPTICVLTHLLLKYGHKPTMHPKNFTGLCIIILR